MKEHLINQICRATQKCSDDYKFDEQYHKTFKELAQMEIDFTEKYQENADLCAEFKKFSDINNDLSSQECDLYYREGFKMGFLLAMDVFDCK